MNVNQIKQAAMSAAAIGGADWRISPKINHGYPIIVMPDGRPCAGVVGGGHARPFSFMEKQSIGLHLATTSPAAVIELIVRTEKADATNHVLVKALQAVVENWTAQFERYGHLAPEWVKSARAALTKAGAA